MAGSLPLPRVTTLAMAGIQPVNTINNVLVDGKVPIRVTGDVAELLSRYPDISLKHQRIDVPNFHRYCSNTVVGMFDTDEHAQKGLEAAEQQMRLNPGPGIERTTEIGPRAEYAIIWVFHVNRLGGVFSHWDAVSRSIINETGPKHAYRNGFVIRQASLDDKRVSVITFGEGTADASDWYDPSSFKAWRNGNFGPSGFIECDDTIRSELWRLPGASKPLPIPLLAP